VLRIERISENGSIRLCLSGELRSSDLKEVQTEIAKVAPQIVLDLAEVSLVDFNSVRWLAAIETAGFKVESGASYIREWMRQEKS
jgi:ABC-type transporter Mla MlaB component